jgi:cytochrome c551/c552
MTRTRWAHIGWPVSLLAGAVILASCATLGGASREVAGPRLFPFPGDWAKIPAKAVTLLYPGQASWEYLTSNAHPGAAAMENGCGACHAGQEQKLGAKLVTAGPREAEPIAGKAPTLDLAVRAAYDAEYVYFQFRWATATPHPLHTLWRFDGKQWVAWGGPKPDATKKGIPPSYEDRLTVLFDEPNNVPAADGAKATFSQVGCWMTCHNSMRAMPNDVPKTALDPHPYWGSQGRKVGDIRKYLLITRTSQDAAGAWDKVKPAAELNALKAAGKFLDLWQWRAGRSNAVGMPVTTGCWSTGTPTPAAPLFSRPKPEFMFDREDAGFAPSREKISGRVGQAAWSRGRPRCHWPQATFAEGDFLRSTFSAPAGQRRGCPTFGRYADGHWVVEIRRKQVTGHPDDKALRPGPAYPVGFAVFDDTVSNRRHYVSLPLTVGIGVAGDVQAVKVGP